MKWEILKAKWMRKKGIKEQKRLRKEDLKNALNDRVCYYTEAVARQ